MSCHRRLHTFAVGRRKEEKQRRKLQPITGAAKIVRLPLDELPWWAGCWPFLKLETKSFNDFSARVVVTRAGMYICHEHRDSV